MKKVPQVRLELLHLCSQIDDLDAAIQPIQTVIGQTDGGVASHFFSGIGNDGWKDTNHHDRYNLLRHYVNLERSMMENDLSLEE